MALLTYVPIYLATTGVQRLLAAEPVVLLTELVVQGLIAGAGTLYTYSKMVALLGPARAAVFPALAPGIAAFMAWPVLGMAAHRCRSHGAVDRGDRAAGHGDGRLCRGPAEGTRGGCSDGRVAGG